jgi:DNA polymerase V
MPKGGRRIGAGRPVGTGKYQEPTKAIRVPISIIEKIRTLVQNDRHSYALPLYTAKISAGLPSPADGDVELRIDLNSYLVRKPDSTFLVRVSGDSMINAGIYEDDILIVDHSLNPQHGKIVVAAIDGQLTVKRLHRENQEVMLVPENAEYQPIRLTSENNFYICGVVTNVIHSV